MLIQLSELQIIQETLFLLNLGKVYATKKPPISRKAVFVFIQ